MMQKKIKIMTIFCTRPSAIKMAPIVQALSFHPSFENIICSTGQHREMLDQVLRLFHITPQYDLNVMTENQHLTSITTQVLTHLKSVLEHTRPDCVLVQGDTTSTMSAALAAFYQKIPVMHVEAGLRTHDLFSPYPEEMNRIVTSRIAQHHFAPTETAKQNLLNENVNPKTIHVTGNTVIDALLWMKNELAKSPIVDPVIESIIEKRKPIILITGHRRENFGAGFERICFALKQLALSHPEWEFIYPVHLNPNVLKPVSERLSGLPNFHLIKPQDYAPFVYLMDKAKLIITDSGGVQEEAPSLGKPVLVTREMTERPEAVSVGTVILVGTNPAKIIHETESLMTNAERYLAMSRITNPYGDGHAAERIVGFLEKMFVQPLDEIKEDFNALAGTPTSVAL